MKSVAAAWLALPLTAGSVLASGGIECIAPDSDASLKLTIGTLPVLSVVGASMTAGDQTWELNGEGENSIAVGQAFREGGEMRIDFTDLNVEQILIEVRLFSVAQERDMATAGTLRISGVGAWPVTCTGP